ncbi:membrane fusion protein, multidrug efflux system [Granulicella pectinivorans]|uniref:Membrane fusion protein, multidrug efflux system n=1 Tax=Granulicella pectinivorans TaxID=474950 RepID=A0A1I6MHA6_9BACT|nr:HlyD family secretion protein [Granulicella pectinivorans]SFS15049.1 membrane fusion protein, multidrug efflux system [Granulicella pectinivorans]
MATQEEVKNNQSGDQTAPASEPEKSNPAKKAIIFGVILLLILGAGFYYWRSTFTEDTDDAQVDGDLYQVSSRVTGQVTKVYVEDNQTVQAGQLLAEVDPTDYEVALNQAKANLASAQAAAIQAQVNVPITATTTSTQVSTSSSDVRSVEAQIAQSQNQAAAAQQRIEQAKANAAKAALDVDRYTPLVQKDVISKQQYDAALATAAATRAAVLEAQAALIAQQDQTRQAQQKLAQSRSQANESAKNGPQQVKAQQARAQAALADVKQAEAKVQQAELNLSYTKITAPTAGIVNKKNVQVGANLAIGQDLLTIIPVTDLWVTANFKETQLDKIRPGQKVDIKVDALGGRHFTGTVAQVGGATGSRLSLFPPENATGNYVKVVQRIPVRINFTNLDKENKDFALRPGFSVTPDVEVK